ncbi:hypothetical protein [Enterococcus pallens]|uniref:Uncharacterized protein n=1 Tax=Enterococcus pallens ATCC BAA-351 TaxID=1158607 RepID=R2SI25_9ENTE|nr:hypothetical protein [Enterococcus pallens]EOH87849.1 hypothetical protein UAU_04704 [Enterococcus pallens ATCC BAA-351]EOU18063.1 hypothetical protein I588_03052 [Enterococcus pallens ATCC BAA-351]OJG82313.1 hypothetical protein RV10_GL000134 [Enterococcus pallens]
MIEENWSEDFEQRQEKEAELEKRTLAFTESYESGNITEEEYQASLHTEYDHAEPDVDWVPIEDPLDPNHKVVQEIDQELSQEFQEELESEVNNPGNVEAIGDTLDVSDSNQSIEE